MNNWGEFIKNYYLSGLFLLSFAIIAVIIVLVFANFYGLDSEGSIVIYTDTLRELSVLGSSTDLYKVIIFACFLFMLNLILAMELMRKEPYLSYLLGASTLAFASLILVVIIDIMLIN